MNRPLHVAAVLSALLVSGCNAEFDDISQAADHRGVVGERCQVQAPLNAFGYTLNVERDKRTDAVVLTSLRLSGPEITFSARVPAGTTLEVVSIRKCKNCPFDERVEYRMRSSRTDTEFGDVPVYMNLDSVEPGAIACTSLKGRWSAA